MHPICQQTLIANFTNSELQRHAMDVEALLANPNVRKFVDWVAKKDPDFTATTAKSRSFLRAGLVRSRRLDPDMIFLRNSGKKRRSASREPPGGEGRRAGRLR